VSSILAFDTASAHCAACLLVDGTATVRVDSMSKGQAEHLMPMLEEVLAAADLGWADLDAIGVGTGPGNFTGIRISVSAARGLALGLGIPAVGVTHLEAQVHGIARPATAISPAPRGHVYLQHFSPAPSAPCLVPHDDPRAADASPPLPATTMLTHMAKITSERMHDNPPRPAPYYVRAADAAPPRDPAPVILA
jgi:tRNA threonylcarbamoyl adenosine modification protein YeaZ